MSWILNARSSEIGLLLKEKEGQRDKLGLIKPGDKSNIY